VVEENKAFSHMKTLETENSKIPTKTEIIEPQEQQKEALRGEYYPEKILEN